MSVTSSDLSEASTKVNGEVESPTSPKFRARKALQRVATSADGPDVLLFLIAFRILNALIVKTFFQPDEYFQSLEPAWQMVFGRDSGAWITWEWTNHLRSAMHPSIFAAVFFVSDLLADTLRLPPIARAELLIEAPKVLQAIFAAFGDYYTWKLAQGVYGQGSQRAWAVLFLTVASPWQWFCSTRTFSNGLESTLTILALYNWPWHWSFSSRRYSQTDDQGLRTRDFGDDRGSVDETTRLRRSLLLAALATILRPTNVLIWITLGLMTLWKPLTVGRFLRMRQSTRSGWVFFPAWSFRAKAKERIALVKEAAICGTIIVVLSVLVDRLYYQIWVFPPLEFLLFNVVQSVSTFYGINDWHYYLSQGYPLLLTTALPFTLVGVYRALSPRYCRSTNSAIARAIPAQLATIALMVPAVLSVISHKEVRFIYPLLPLLHILTADPLTAWFGPALTNRLTHQKLAPPYRLTKRFLLFFLLGANSTISFYLTTVHNSGVISVLGYLRNQYEVYYLPSSTPSTDTGSSSNLTAAFLMPCHSTPWRSHLLYPPTSALPGIDAWALSCEPPLSMCAEDKATYMDEADVFYADPILWLRKHMSRQPPRPRGVFGSVPRSRQRETMDVTDGGGKPWPDYLVFFEQLESVMHAALQGGGYEECWRTFNTQWHDDWRRRGDVVVWCVHPERRERTGKMPAKMHWLEDWLRIAREQVHDLKDMVVDFYDESSPVERKTLGGGRGPWGIGGEVKRHEDGSIVAGHSVMEKGFWKRRDAEMPEGGKWPWSWVFGGRSKPRKRWWQRSLWS